MNARLAIPVIWTLACALLVKLLTAWGQLPDRVAVHFGMAMQPNGWSSKSALAAIVLIAVLGQAALATFVLLRVGSAAGWIGLILVLVNVVLVCAFWQTINYNAEGTRFQPLWTFVPMIVLFASITVLMGKLVLDYYRR
ncbi:MAG TPA: DUF1648 domain-containing protein [Candidatus Angelobacter sp.]